MQPYSRDLRDRVLRALEWGDRPTEIARRFEVTRVWVYWVRDRAEKTGERGSRPMGTSVNAHLFYMITDNIAGCGLRTRSGQHRRLLDRERRIRQAKFHVTKSLDSFDFLAMPTLKGIQCSGPQ